MFARKKPNIQNVKNQDKFKRLIDMMQTYVYIDYLRDAKPMIDKYLVD